jgi:ribosome-associated translation inhibitor RaiA
LKPEAYLPLQEEYLKYKARQKDRRERLYKEVNNMIMTKNGSVATWEFVRKRLDSLFGAPESSDNWVTEIKKLNWNSNSNFSWLKFSGDVQKLDIKMEITGRILNGNNDADDLETKLDLIYVWEEKLAELEKFTKEVERNSSAVNKYQVLKDRCECVLCLSDYKALKGDW